MNIFQTVLMAIKSVVNNKVRSILTMLGVIIGVSSVIILVSVIQGVQAKSMESWMSTGIDQIQVEYWGEDSTFNDTLKEFVSDELSDYVTFCTPVYNTSLSPQYLNKIPEYTRAFYSDDTYIGLSNLEISMGRNITYGDVKSRTKVVVIGEFLRKEFFGGLSDPTGKKIKIAGEDYTVVGVLKEKQDGSLYSSDNTMILPHSTLIFNKQENSRKVSNFILTASDADATTYALEHINNNFKKVFKDSDNVMAYTNNDWIEDVQNQTKMLSLAVGAIGGISLLVGGIGIMNIMLVSVTERTREIGIRMAIGAKRKNIITQFLIEAAAVSGFGGIIGILIGSFGTVLIGSFIIKDIIYPSPSIVIGSFIFSVFLGVFFGFHPANKASKLNPIDALRTQ